MTLWLKQHGATLTLMAVLIAAGVLSYDAVKRGAIRNNLHQRTDTLTQKLQHAATSPTDQNNEKPATDAAARINKRHLFVPAPPPTFRNILGVLGNRVLYPGGQSLGVGDTKDGAVIKAVGSSSVEFELEGKIITINVFN